MQTRICPNEGGLELRYTLTGKQKKELKRLDTIPLFYYNIRYYGQEKDGKTYSCHSRKYYQIRDGIF